MNEESQALICSHILTHSSSKSDFIRHPYLLAGGIVQGLCSDCDANPSRHHTTNCNFQIISRCLLKIIFQLAIFIRIILIESLLASR